MITRVLWGTESLSSGFVSSFPHILTVKLKKSSEQKFETGRFRDADLRMGETHWSHYVILIGWFFSLGILVVIVPLTMVSWIDVIRALTFAALLPLLIPYRFYRKFLGLERLEMFLFSIVGLGPPIVTLMLLINFLSVSPYQTSLYEVKGFDKVETLLTTEVVIKLGDKALQDQEKFRTFSYGTYKGEPCIEVAVGEGIFGLIVLRDYEFTNSCIN